MSSVKQESPERQGRFEPLAAADSAKKAKHNRPSISELLGCEWNQCGVYRRIIWDERISPGAFRYWHYLRDQMDARGFVREYYASMRVVVAALHCKHESITRWNAELSSGEYLSWEDHGKEHKHRYRVLNGFGQPMKGANSGQWELPMVYGMERRRVPPMVHTTLPFGDDGVPPMVHAPYIQGNEVRGNGTNRRELWQISKDIERLQAMKADLGPPSLERSEKLKKIKWAISRLRDEALEGIVPSSQSSPRAEPASRPIAKSVCPDDPGPMPGDPAYEDHIKNL